MRILQLFLLAVALLSAVPEAAAGELKIATVDLNRVMNEVEEGKAEQARLQTIYEGKRAELAQMEEALVSLNKEYQSQAAVLSATAKQDYEQRLYQQQATYQQAMALAEQEMQQAQLQVMDKLMGKMREVAEQVAKEKGYTMVLESSQGLVVWADESVDITADVITRYNAAE